MKKYPLIAIVILFSFLGLGEVEKIDPPLLQELHQSLQQDVHFQFARTVAANAELSNLVVDPDRIHRMDSHFSHRIPGQKITDQKSTGRCWMYAGLNILRARAAKNLNAEDIEFSENHLFFFDKLEKANLFLQAMEKYRDRDLDDRYVTFLLGSPVPDGGQWVGMVELIKKYGVVPLKVMPQTYHSDHSRTTNRILARILRKAGLGIREEPDLQKRKELRLDTLKKVYKVLAVNLGIPPQSFTYRYLDRDGKIVQTREYTPQSFFTEVVDVDLDDFYALYSIPTRPYERLYQIDLDQAVYERPSMRFVNLAIGELKKMARASVLADQPVWFGCDVGEDSFKDRGVMVPDLYNYAAVYDLDLSMTRKESFQARTNNPTHAMVFTGIDIQDDRVRKWLVENSWGKKFGNEGYYHMADGWFDRFVQVVVIHRDFISPRILKIFEGRAQLLPPWDPMYRVVKMVR